VKTIRRIVTGVVLFCWGTLNGIAAVSDGLPLWTNRYHGPEPNDNDPIALAVDRSGSVVVTGYSPGAAGGNDFATIKYSGAGIPLWTNRYSAPYNYDDYATGVAIDANENVFVTGHSQYYVGGGFKYFYATVAYSSVGEPLWTNLYADTGNSLALAIALDKSGNVFVTGEASNDIGGFNYATVAYSGVGKPLWTNWYNGPGNSLDYANAIAVDANGNVFVTGHSVDVSPSDVVGFATVAYSGAGVPLWTNRFRAPEDFAESKPVAIAVDNRGKVFVTGYSGFPTSTNFYYDYVTLAYTINGIPLWTNRFDGPANANDRARALVVDTSGTVLVTGISIGTHGYQDYATIAYSGAGELLWTNRLNSPYAADAQTMAITADPRGNAFVTGKAVTTVNGVGYYGYYTVALSSAGVPLWTNSYNGPVSPYYSEPTAIAVDGDGNVFVTGSSRNPYNPVHTDYATIKYSAIGPPPLAIRAIYQNVVLRWTNASFHLQTSPVLDSAFTNIPGATSPYTNSVANSQQYFRLQ